MRPALLLALVLAAAPARAQIDRRAEAAVATREFVATHNFSHGRGLAIVPGIFELVELLGEPPLRPIYRRLLEESFGLNMTPEGRAVGLFPLKEPGYSLGAFGCVACHSGKAAGQVYIGLGNKSIDVGTIGRAITRFEKPYEWRKSRRTPEANAVIERGFAFAHKLTHPRIANLTKGLVSINHVNIWFYEQAGMELPPSIPRGGTRVPNLWGIEAKATQAGLFYDGLGKAGSIAWLALPELTAGQTAQGIRDDFARIQRLWWLITRLLPPAYPFAIDRAKAARGQAVYAESCMKCHGSYERDAADLPVFLPPLFNTLAEVGTDADRADATTDLLRSLIARSPLSDLVQAQDRPKGYFANRLVATWANFPYLHNGSVPTLADLLEKPAARPRFWSLKDQGERDRFDETRVGLTLPRDSGIARSKLEVLGRQGFRDVYSVEREGHSNQGHDFGTDLPAADKQALLEYLKTL